MLLLAQGNNSILHQGALMGRLSFPSDAFEKLQDFVHSGDSVIDVCKCRHAGTH